jgi:hypothetical protein
MPPTRRLLLPTARNRRRIVALFTFSATVKAAVQAHPGILWAAIGVSFVTLIALSCCPGVARSFPGNYICLFLFTLAEGCERVAAVVVAAT